MMHVELPWELVEEILYCLPLQSLIRFKIVCKQWNKLFKSKSFINNNSVRARPQFLVWTESKMYSVSVNLSNNPKIGIQELPLDIPSSDNNKSTSLLPCDGLLFCDWWLWNNNKAAVCNPWLRQTRWIETNNEDFRFRGMGYDSGRPEKSYNIVGYYKTIDIYTLDTNEWKCTNVNPGIQIRRSTNVSLNGNLYWTDLDQETGEYFIQSFDFSRQIHKVFCVLQWITINSSFPVLSTYRKDRLSLLKKLIGTNNNIEVWVTKNKINNDDAVEHVSWIKFMTVSVPISRIFSPSFFIDNVYNKKSLVMCCLDDGNEKLCIYIVRGKALTKIQMDADAKHAINHCSYVPSLIPIPPESPHIFKN
ncbi:hypothetical protein CARUB_v10018516mg [Capsella rubella]|uniref:F-box domain-containing protein n=1 Tax=Capsella rubella TaxID=81985 RepID=R0HMN1_9BRAS|nr:putative F-box/kelch-repeat protein At1g12170 [Capsella rubella]EOA25203.1 hypothetical protein CARUB_v10018516mg [Capsella rubella]